ncbi:MAG: BACON domain-containing protein [Bacteroidales bacterium]|jgi:hypothetical protein|nr:BACON domain-containing protein [Bacteroidales bacterium]
MKKANLFCLSLLLMATAMFTGCEKDNPTENSAIKVDSSSALTQNVFADETQGNGGVTFTTAGAWTSSITETTAPVKSLSLKSVQDASWISISPSSGDRAGSYTVTISLEPNLTGADRTAVITITCGDSEITITVMQKATKEDGSPALSQQQIMDLLRSAWANTKTSPEIAISATNAAFDYPMFLETSQAQKKSLYTEINNTVFIEFEYIDNLTKYVYENGTKYREELPSDFWSDYGNVNDMFREGGFEPEYYTWTVAGNVYTGVSHDGGYLNEATFELTDDKKVKTLHVLDADDGVVDDDITMNFSYGSVNPAFPAGFDQADFPLKGSGQYGGTGTFTNTMAADQPLVVDGAKYDGGSIRFYKEDVELSSALYLEIHFPGQGADVSRLPAGTYHFYDSHIAQSMPEYSFYCQKGVLGGINYYGKGGTVTVSINGDIYTIEVDMDTYHGDYGSPTTGKVRGTYTGYLLHE